MKLSQIITTYPKLIPYVRFIDHYFKRCRHDQIQVSAGYLSYVTIMSLVPLIMVMFSIVSAFPIFGEIHQDLERFIFTNFVPTASELIQEHVDGFVANASQMSATAIFFLFVLAMMLISAVDKSLNRIWRIHKRRKAITSFAIYWMILTLGPVLISVSILATTYVVSLMSDSGLDIGMVQSLMIRALPLISSMAGFIVLYMLVPNTHVRFKYACYGAIIATILFELAKKGFAAYVTHLPSYEAIYGAIAIIPILFVWVYLSWLVVFVGAEFTACLQEVATGTHRSSRLKNK
ncbi:virulence factor BrkB family protein [Thalassotalea crassostreae]|uniref:virulence factor BrkB family protein n=1 Tax=Thalassotalea crassostreae TaxID=1763536 RepID=UPI0008383574|nr:virulence factor BrkB family protein [Thalassotalea crassostreae]